MYPTLIDTQTLTEHSTHSQKIGWVSTVTFFYLYIYIFLLAKGQQKYEEIEARVGGPVNILFYYL